MDEVFTDESSAQFFQLVHMFQRSAYVHLSMLPGPEEEPIWNPAEAKAAIDMLQMLQTKTEGNLDTGEAQLLKGIIAELQLDFVRAPDRRKAAEAQAAEEEETRQIFESPRQASAEVLADDEEE